MVLRGELLHLETEIWSKKRGRLLHLETEIWSKKEDCYTWKQIYTFIEKRIDTLENRDMRRPSTQGNRKRELDCFTLTHEYAQKEEDKDSEHRNRNMVREMRMFSKHCLETGI